MTEKEQDVMECPNHYTKESYENAFFVTEKETVVCEGCKNLVYKQGIMTCRLFQ